MSWISSSLHFKPAINHLWHYRTMCLFQSKGRNFSTMHTDQLAHRVLALDGGGSRGIISGTVMKYMEEKTGKPIHTLFERIGGTSTGGILALSASAPEEAGSTKPRFSAEEVLSIYTKPGMGKHIFTPAPKDSLGNKPSLNLLSVSFGLGNNPAVFDTDLPYLRPLLRTQCTASNLEKTLQERFSGLKLGDMLNEVLITSLDVNTRIPRIFTRALAREQSRENFPAWQVARVTSAAPTYFDPYEIDGQHLVDGGLVANNPTMCMLVDAQRRGIPLHKIVCVSLGTGAYNPALNTHGYGQVRMLLNIFDIISAASDELVHQQASDLLKERYHRFQVQLKRNISLDSVDKSSIEELQEIGAQHVRANRERLDRICDELQAIGEKRKNAC